MKSERIRIARRSLAAAAHRSVAVWTLLALAAVSTGCGYALAGRGSFLPDYIRNIGVPLFGNATPVYDIERRVSERVRSELSGRGKYKVYTTEAGNDAVLTGEISSITIQPISFNQQQQASRYVLILTARVEFKDLKTGKMLWANPALQFRDEFEPATAANALDPTAFFGQDTNALERLATEFARSVVSALLEAF
jgi:outer membrane lipopolysaccharide assembly protein LptE/RlpB